MSEGSVEVETVYSAPQMKDTAVLTTTREHMTTMYCICFPKREQKIRLLVGGGGTGTKESDNDLE